MSESLENMIRRRQDELRGGPLPPPSVRERAVERMRPLADWCDERGWVLAAGFFSLAIMLDAVAAIMRDAAR
jgi:hypothetical protein